MNQMQRDLIDRIAQRVLDIERIAVPVSNMETIVRQLGGCILTDFSVVDGKIIKNGNSFKILVASDNFNDRRTRFTIAHELGHLFLHMGFGSNPEQWEKATTETYNRLGSSKEESEANEFAAAFLMPEDKYRKQIDKNIDQKYFKENGIERVNLTKVAEYFNVSILAASNRGKFLGILKW